jgi:hypothetical protein
MVANPSHNSLVVLPAGVVGCHAGMVTRTGSRLLQGYFRKSGR